MDKTKFYDRMRRMIEARTGFTPVIEESKGGARIACELAVSEVEPGQTVYVETRAAERHGVWTIGEGWTAYSRFRDGFHEQVGELPCLSGTLADADAVLGEMMERLGAHRHGAAGDAQAIRRAIREDVAERAAEPERDTEGRVIVPAVLNVYPDASGGFVAAVSGGNSNTPFGGVIGHGPTREKAVEEWRLRAVMDTRYNLGTVEIVDRETEPEYTTESLGRYNQRGYRFYVVLDGKIESGWEYREDALDQTADLPRSPRVLTRTGLHRIGLDPDHDGDWLTGPVREAKEDEACDVEAARSAWQRIERLKTEFDDLWPKKDARIHERAIKIANDIQTLAYSIPRPIHLFRSLTADERECLSYRVKADKVLDEVKVLVGNEWWDDWQRSMSEAKEDEGAPVGQAVDIDGEVPIVGSGAGKPKGAKGQAKTKDEKAEKSDEEVAAIVALVADWYRADKAAAKRVKEAMAEIGTGKKARAKLVDWLRDDLDNMVSTMGFEGESLPALVLQMVLDYVDLPAVVDGWLKGDDKEAEEPDEREEEDEEEEEETKAEDETEEDAEEPVTEAKKGEREADGRTALRALRVFRSKLGLKGTKAKEWEAVLAEDGIEIANHVTGQRYAVDRVDDGTEFEFEDIQEAEED